MSANYQKLNLDLSASLYMDFWVRSDYFGFHWHYHPEIEICYVKQGYGQRIVGESIERFEAGDLVLLGSNLPHCWISDDAFNELSSQMEVYVIHLDVRKLMGQLAIQEWQELRQFLEQARMGFAFSLTKDPQLLKALRDFEQAEGMQKTLCLMTLLLLMYQAKARHSLCPSSYIPETGKQVEERIIRVCSYIHEHYREKISIATLAGMAHMNESAFCRFFKKVLGKTSIEYINELRINTASHELIMSTKPINQIALEQGFVSLSQFNQLFKRYNQMTPSAYRKASLKTA